MTSTDTTLTIRNRSRLPQGRVVQVSVSRLNVSYVALLVLVLGGLAFLGGVAVGTGGYYRHGVEAVTSGLGEGNMVKAALLAPDRATKASLAERMSAIEVRLDELSDGYAHEGKLRESLTSAFMANSEKLGNIQDAMQGMEDAIRDVVASNSKTEDALDGLQTAIKRARELATEEAQSDRETEDEDP